jgi:molybdenum cofactor biosynthesis enzyme MoaA
MPATGVTLTSKENLLETNELKRLCKMFVTNGVKKIRLTGGEPTLRNDLLEIVGRSLNVTIVKEELFYSAGIDCLGNLRPLGLKSIGMTSNGIALKRKLSDLKLYGVDSLNLSLDTLDEFKFELMTRRRGNLFRFDRD